MASRSLRALGGLTAWKDVVPGAKSHSSSPHGVENLPSQRLDPEHNSPAFMYCLAPVERTFPGQIPPVFFTSCIFFSSCKTT